MESTSLNQTVKKIIFNEKIKYLFWGVMTTLVYFVVRFVTMMIFSNAMIPVAFAQVISVTFAFIVNKYFVFNSTKTTTSLFKQMTNFVTGRIGVAGLDFLITYLTIDKFSGNLIQVFHLSQINYQFVLFSSPLTHKLIGSPVLLNAFVWVIIIQVLAIVINYVVSKYFAFK